jgi:putative peptidoglycan lipid II flippase
LIAFSGLVTTNILSRLGESAASAYSWGWRIMQIPETLIGTAMGVVIFPTLAVMSSLGNLDGKRDAMSGALRFILIATIPSAIGLILIGRPMISLLERGAFDASASDLVYNTLQFFSLGIVVHSMLEIVARSFYADKDTFTPLMAAFGGAAINLVAAFLFSDVGRVQGMALQNAAAITLGQFGVASYHGNVGGLALANTLGVTFEVVALGIILRRRWRGMNETLLGQTVVKTLLASLVMGAVVVIVGSAWVILGIAMGSFTSIVMQLGVQVAAGAAAFIFTALILRMDELKTLLALVLRRRRIAEVPA